MHQENVSVDIHLSTGEPVHVRTSATDAQRIANQLQRKLKGEEITQVRFNLSEEPGHYIVLDTSVVQAMIVTPARTRG